MPRRRGALPRTRCALPPTWRRPLPVRALQARCRARDHERLLAYPHFVAIFAVQGDRSVGGLAASDPPKAERARSEVRHCDLAPAAEHRRSRSATALIRRLVEIAAQRGARMVFAQADPGDEAAIALCAGHGTRGDVHHVDFPVPGAGAAGE
jgi:aminoglycoside 3-N-acetyltransferase I